MENINNKTLTALLLKSGIKQSAEEIIKERKESQRQKKMSNDKNGIVDAPNSIINEETITSYSKDSNVLCKYCKKEFLSTSLLKHIARNEPCKLFYGVEFENLKKQRNTNDFIRKTKKTNCFLCLLVENL